MLHSSTSCQPPNPLANRHDGWTSLMNMTSPSSIVQAGFTATAMLCHGAPVKGVRRWTVSSVGGQPRHLLLSRSLATQCQQRAPLRCRRRFASFRFILRPTSLQTCALSTRHPTLHQTSWRHRNFRFRRVKQHTPHQRMTSTARSQVLSITTEPASINLDDICEAQSADDNLQPVIQALVEGVKPPQGSLRNYPEEARVLFSQWIRSSLRIASCIAAITTQTVPLSTLQVVLPAKLRHPYVERLHAELGHLGRAKTCMALARQAYFPGWRSLTGMLVHTCPTCNLHQRSHQRPRQANLKPMREFRPMAVIHADLVGPLPEGKNSRNQRGFQYKV